MKLAQVSIGSERSNSSSSGEVIVVATMCQ